MAAPNIVNVTDIRGKTNVANVTTVATSIVTNASSSGKVFKVNALYISNIDGANTADITVDFFRSSIAYPIASTISVPSDSTLDILVKSIYLEEGDSLRCTSSANNDLVVVCSYEEIF